MTSVNPPAMFDHLPYLIDQAHRRMQQDLASLVDTRPFPELRGSHMKILSMIPPGGARPSVLAATANMTRPALGEIVAHLRDHGYVDVTADPEDGRAVVVTHTARGRKADEAATKGIAAMHRQWRQELGDEPFRALLKALSELTSGQVTPANHGH